MATVFIKNNIDVNVQNDKGVTALMIGQKLFHCIVFNFINICFFISQVAENNNLSITDLLIENKANINAQDSSGQTALMIGNYYKINYL